MQPEYIRYSCQLALPGFGEAAQQKLRAAKVLVVGMGGLGCPAAQYMAAAGVGTLGIADGDVIAEANLHRQILYTKNEVGQKKIAVAQARLQAQNPQIEIVKHDVSVDAGNVMALIEQYDIVVDCTDNFETRYLLNDACVLTGKPLVYGAVYQYEGQVAVWNMVNTDSTHTPNYRDLFPEVNAAVVPDCAVGGVLPTLTGMIGAMQANEVIKYITGTGELLAGKLLLLDVQTMHSRVVTIGNVTKTDITELQTSVAVPVIGIEEWEKNKDNYTLIDVRTREEHAAGNIGGVNIPLAEIADAEIDLSKPVVCYCASGRRSKEAVRIIKKRYKYSQVFSLQN
jgi:adenylyltransferase/sulfurtransferase